MSHPSTNSASSSVPTSKPDLLDRLPPSRWSAASWLAMLLTIAALVVGWYGTFYEMWFRWFPAWNQMKTASLMDRLTEGDSYYSHGPLVPLTSLVLAFFIYKRVGFPARRSLWATVLGGLLLAGFLLLHMMSAYARVTFVSGFSLIAVLGGLVLLMGGWSLARAYWLPIVILLFMVPLPEVAIADLNFRLKSVASDMAVWLVNHLFGIPAVKEGSYVYLPLGADGSPKNLTVENVCSGLRSLISLTFFASLFALVCRVKGFWRVFMLLMAVPVAILCNVVRITALSVVAHYWGLEASSKGAWFHDFSGIFVFAVALAMLFGLEALIILFSHLVKRDWTDMRLLGFLDRLPQTARGTIRSPGWVTVGVLVLVAGATVWLTRELPAHNVSQTAASAVPAQLTIMGADYRSIDFPVDPKVLAILETDDYLSRQYLRKGPAKQDGSQAPDAVELLIVFSPNNRKGTHPPEVCLEGAGNIILSKSIESVTLSDGRSVPMRELVTQAGQRSYLHLYVYKSGRSYTPSFLRQQAMIFLNGIIDRNAAGALIRFTVRVDGQNVDQARRQALTSAGQMMNWIDQGLR